MSHCSALFLLTLGRALSTDVTDSDERAKVIEDLAPMLPQSEVDALREHAGLPPERVS